MHIHSPVVKSLNWATIPRKYLEFRVRWQRIVPQMDIAGIGSRATEHFHGLYDDAENQYNLTLRFCLWSEVIQKGSLNDLFDMELTEFDMKQ